MKKALTALYCLSLLVKGFSNDRQPIIPFLDSLFHSGIEAGMIPGGVFVMVDSDSVWHLSGYGKANSEQSILVDSNNTLFQLGSVGKVFTAIAVLQQVQKGNLNLDIDINEYLTEWQLEKKFDDSITLHHLLTHSAGFDDRVIGYMARNNASTISLGDHLKDRMPLQFIPSGQSINYSNYGYALGGHLVELASKTDFSRYIQNEIFKRAGMTKSTYYLPDDFITNPNYAVGYRTSTEIEQVASGGPRHAIPAGSILSTGRDMANFLQLLLRRNTLLDTVGFNYLLNQQFTNHQKLNGYSYGMEVQNFNGIKVLAKGGQVPGFLSIILIVPKMDLAMFMAINTETDDFMELFVSEMKNKIFSSKEKKALPIEPVDVSPFTGIFLNQRQNHNTIEELFAIFRAKFQLWESENGNLECYHNGDYHEYVHEGNHVFRNSENPDQKIIFLDDKNGNINRMYRNTVIGGIEIPSSFERATFFGRPRFVNDEYPYVLLIVVSYFLLPFGWIVRRVIKGKQSTKMDVYGHTFAFAYLALFLSSIFAFWLPLIKNLKDIYYEFPANLISASYAHYGLAIIALVLLGKSAQIWINKSATWYFRVYYSLFSVACLSYVLLLVRWHALPLSW